MSDHNDHIDKLTPELIQQYLTNSLSSDMQHQVERYLLDHPFEAEAFEGVAAIDSSDFVNEVEDLKSQLVHRVEEQLVVPIWQQYWKVAAMITILIVSTFLILEFTGKTPLDERKLSINRDSIFPEVKQSSETLLANDDSSLAAEDVNDKEIDEIVELRQVEEVLRNGSERPAEQELKIEETIAAEVISKESKREEVKELSRPDQVFAAPAGQEGQSQMSSEVMMSTSKSARLPEVNTKVARDKVTSQEEKSTLIGINVDASPLGGMAAFQNYIAAALQYPKEAIENNISGTVVVEVTIDAQGQFTHFEILEGLGYGCDEEVIRLIKEGPKWRPAIQQGKPATEKVILDVTFNP